MAHRLVALDRLGRGEDVEAALLHRSLGVGLDRVECGVPVGLRGASDPPPVGRGDRPAAFLDDAA